MKKILTTSTKIVQAGFAVKEAINFVLHPVKIARNMIKKTLIKTIVYIVKKAINLSMKNKINNDSHIIVRQLNALTDCNCDMTGLTKKLNFQMTLDSLLKESEEVEEYRVLKYVNLTGVKNKLSSYKNSLRNEIYEYIVENNFENIKILVNGVNEIFKIPTEIVGCEFVNCKINVKEHDEVKKNFILFFDIEFAIKSSN